MADPYNPRTAPAKVVADAHAWYAAHKAHVDRLLSEEDVPAVKPTGSDLYRPEIWKDIHWRWLFSKQYTIKD